MTLSHLDDQGRAQMVDVSAKADTALETADAKNAALKAVFPVLLSFLRLQ
jgi:molybdenum cofactor biosynthesis enzyme